MEKICSVWIMMLIRIKYSSTKSNIVLMTRKRVCRTYIFIQVSSVTLRILHVLRICQVKMTDLCIPTCFCKISVHSDGATMSISLKRLFQVRNLMPVTQIISIQEPFSYKSAVDPATHSFSINHYTVHKNSLR